jgi:hypothetical protein
LLLFNGPVLVFADIGLLPDVLNPGIVPYELGRRDLSRISETNPEWGRTWSDGITYSTTRWSACSRWRPCTGWRPDVARPRRCDHFESGEVRTGNRSER